MEGQAFLMLMIICLECEALYFVSESDSNYPEDFCSKDCEVEYGPIGQDYQDS